MKDVVYFSGIRQTEELLALVRRARDSLDEILGPAADTVVAEWDRAEGARKRALVLLRLSDGIGAVIGVFEPEELEVPARVCARLTQLRDLLQARSEQALDCLALGNEPDRPPGLDDLETQLADLWGKLEEVRRMKRGPSRWAIVWTILSALISSLVVSLLMR